MQLWHGLSHDDEHGDDHDQEVELIPCRAQIRLLADTTFAMRDYDTALSMYRLARDDFKSVSTESGLKAVLFGTIYLAGDRALLHLGCANEMIARCLLCLALFKQRRTKSLVADPRIDVGLQDGEPPCVNSRRSKL